MAKTASVLIVDDSSHCAEIMRLAFETCADVEAKTETRASLALDRIRSETPDFVMLDLIMPDVDGFEVLRRLREEGDKTPVVMCSGATRQADIDRAYALGCNRFIEKPTSLAGYREFAASLIEAWRKDAALAANSPLSQSSLSQNPLSQSSVSQSPVSSTSSPAARGNVAGVR